MARNMTFSVSLSLLTKNFQKGIRSVQNSLNKLRGQFQTLLGGIGMGVGLQELIENAKQLDKAHATLKNVSGAAQLFGENLKFVETLSKKYNQDLITLTGNFAKFHSAAAYAGMSLEEQQHIYEALTRSAAYFNLTADETNGVMLAVQQMISKGKVSSEELRRQLGERLPGAMNLAAKAMGYGADEMGEFEKAIRLGAITADELLPKLADELFNLTGNFNVDTIQGQTARLKNSFTNLVAELRVGDIYKSFLKGLANGLDYLSKNLKDVAYAVSGVLGALLMKGGLEKGVNAWQSMFSDIEKELAKAKTNMKVLKKELDDIANTPGLPLQPYITNPSNGRVMVSQGVAQHMSQEEYEKLRRLAADYNKELGRSNVLQDQLNNKLGTAGKRLGENVTKMLKMVGIQALYYAIAAAVSYVITKVVKWYKEQKRIKGIVQDTRNELEKMSDALGVDDVELTQMQEMLKLTGDLALSESDREKVIKRINKLLGLQDDKAFDLASSNADINKAIEDRLALMEKERRYQATLQLISQKKNKITELGIENERLGKEIEASRKKNQTQSTGSLAVDIYDALGGSRVGGPNMGAKENQIKTNNQEIAELNKAIAELEQVIKDEGLAIGAQDRQTILEGGPEPTNPLDEDLKKEYERIQKEHNNKLRALNEQLADGAIKQEDYDKALKDLYFSTLQSIYALDNINENEDAFAKAILERVKEYLKNEVIASETNDALEKYNKEVEKVRNQYNNGLITQKELDDEIYNLTEEVLKTIGGLGTLTEAAEELAESFKKQKRQKVLDELGKEEAPSMGDFDTTFDYKKESSEMYQENADYLKEYADELEDYIEKLEEYRKSLTGDDLKALNENIELLEGNLETLTGKAESFAQAAKFAEIQEDISSMKQELAEGIWDNITGIATAAERLTNSFKSLSDTWNDTDASGWEKFLTVFTTIISTIETLVGVYKTLQAAVSIYKGIQMAMAAGEQAAIGIEVEKLAVMKAQSAVAKELAVAKGLQSAAAVPYPANLAAIASTSAALAAAFAAIPKFAQGGIVKSSSTVGDRNLVRVNGGEAILTQGQQTTLWKLLNGQGGLSKTGGNVEFKIRGADLVGTINNYNKKISK